MNELVQSLTASGIKHQDAVRIAKAIMAATDREPVRKFYRDPGPGYEAPPGTSNSFALYASAAGTSYSQVDERFGRGGAALGVTGLSIFDGQIIVNEVFSSGIQNDGDIENTGTIDTKKLNAKSINVLRSASINSTSVETSVPLIASGGLFSRAGSILSGDNLIDGPLTIQNQVFWGNALRVPAEKRVLTTATAANGNVVFGLAGVAVLNDRGDQGNVVIKANFTPTTTIIKNATGVTFDENSCTVSVTWEDIEVLTGGTVTLSVT